MAHLPYPSMRKLQSNELFDLGNSHEPHLDATLSAAQKQNRPNKPGGLKFVE